MGASRAGRAAAAAGLLAASGAAALAHEAAWQRLWAPLAGAGVATASVIVAGTLLGLGAGAAIGGPLSDRARRPGRVFAWAEALGALACLGVPVVADGVAGAAGCGLLPGLHLVVAGGAALVASLPLGASLPAAVRALAPPRGRAGPLLGLLYAANTLGAVGGVLLATGFGFEDLGVRETIARASMVQAAVAVVATLLLGAPRAGDAGPTGGPVETSAPAGSGGRWTLAAFLAGAAGLALEVAWIRRLTPAVGTTAYAFGTVLGAFLAAIALGAAVWGPRRVAPAGRRPALVLAFAALPAALLPALVGPVARWAGTSLAAAVQAGEAGAFALLRIRSLAAAAVLLPAAAVGGAALPWLLHAADPSPQGVGRAAGRVLAANTVGSALASVLAAFVGIPLLGTAGTLRAAGVLYAVAAAVAAGPGRWRLPLLGLAVVLAALVPLPDEAGRDAVGATFDPGYTDPASAPATFFREGRVSTVVVRDRDGRPELWVDGKVVASASPTDRLHLALLGHLPMLLHPHPRRAAVVGLGTGITATAVATHRPDVLDVFELEGEVVPASEAFRGVGGGLPPSARLHVVDGRFGLLRSEGRYDVITSDPIHPAAAGSAELYTAEHYALLADRLAPGGIACQWLPLYEMAPDDVRLVLRTFSSRFDVAAFVGGPDLVLIGFLPEGRRPVDVPALERRLTGPVADALRPLGLAEAGRLLGLLAADPRRCRTFAGDGPLDTDDRPVLEFSSARAQYTGSSVENLRLLTVVTADLSSLVGEPSADPVRFAAGLDRSRRSRKGMARWMEGTGEGWATALPMFDRLAAEDPTDRLSAQMRDACQGLLALDAARDGDDDTAVAHARAVLARPEAEAYVRLDAAEALSAAGLADEARAAARGVLATAPRSLRARRLARD